MVEKQAKFAKLISEFIIKVEDLGYLLTFGEAYRSLKHAAEEAEKGRGIINSLHTQRLAVDLNAFFCLKYLDGSKDWHIPHLENIGKLWESFGEDCSWGGRFKIRDYNHYSIIHNGIR